MEEKIGKASRFGVEEIALSEAPEAVQEMLSSEINWVEVGVCCDLSTTRGYHLREDGKLEQRTGSNWAFFPIEVYTLQSSDLIQGRF